MSSIHILYNQATVGGIRPLLRPARQIHNVQLDGGSTIRCQSSVRAYCRQSGIRIAARYSGAITSLVDYKTRETLMEHKNVLAVARRLGIPLMAVVSAWMSQRSDVSLATHDAIQNAHDIELEDDDMQALETFD